MLLRSRPLGIARDHLTNAFSSMLRGCQSGTSTSQMTAGMSTITPNDMPSASSQGQEADHSDFLLMDEHHFKPQSKMHLVTKYLSQEHMSSADQFKQHKHVIIKELQSFDHDTGTMPVQIALLSERITYLTEHCLTHKKDHHSRRGLLILLSRRRKQLKYLRKKDFLQYVQVISRYKLRDNYYASGWGEKYRVGTSLKWTPAEPEKEMLPPTEELRALLPKKTTAFQKQKVKEAAQSAIRSEILENRRKNIAHMWQRRLRQRADFMPLELQQPEFEAEMIRARKQMGALSADELAQYQEKARAEWLALQGQRAADKFEFQKGLLDKHGIPLSSTPWGNKQSRSQL